MYTNQSSEPVMHNYKKIKPLACLSRDVFTYHGQCDKVKENFYKIHPRKKEKSIVQWLT